MNILKKFLIILLILIMLLTVGCINQVKEIKNLREMNQAMEDALGMIEKEKTLNFYKKSCSYIKDNGLSDNFSMHYEKNNDKSVNVEFNSICKGVLVEYIYGSDSAGDRHFSFIISFFNCSYNFNPFIIRKIISIIIFR